MIFDTDVLIWAQRGNAKAVKAIIRELDRAASVQTYMELLQDARNRSEQDVVKQFIRDFGFTVLPISENISHRASVYIEQFSLSHGVRCGDALIAATAAENDQTLLSGNKRHFSCIPDLKFKTFRP